MKKNKRQDENTMVSPIPQGDHNKLFTVGGRFFCVFYYLEQSPGQFATSPVAVDFSSASKNLSVLDLIS